MSHAACVAKSGMQQPCSNHANAGHNDVNLEDFKFIPHLGTGHTRGPPVRRVLVRVRTTAVVDTVVVPGYTKRTAVVL